MECIQLLDTNIGGGNQKGRVGRVGVDDRILTLPIPPTLLSLLMSRECVEKHKYTEELLQGNRENSPNQSSVHQWDRGSEK